jgi:hypothetical protein
MISLPEGSAKALFHRDKPGGVTCFHTSLLFVPEAYHDSYFRAGPNAFSQIQINRLLMPLLSKDLQSSTHHASAAGTLGQFFDFLPSREVAVSDNGMSEAGG